MGKEAGIISNTIMMNDNPYQSPQYYEDHNCPIWRMIWFEIEEIAIFITAIVIGAIVGLGLFAGLLGILFIIIGA